ncbi:CoxG family protein [Priestia endophytica]|uniref:Carbon monoxide dehydrogenase subunit G n=1 Tax=Priestia endophytica DSM 13796 TaxID=1121089 RepID=A0A1I6BSP3_9BACI|nr:carbon monoxide dehydrogenase subunit G [Priestia endophytica]KYG34259.1 hypothetical protein AZF06_19630 [Priestia endophytica]MBG9813112.1 hypothetical protein [Priestia endophytica]RAS85131.1 hypothetical protein A4R27_04010 [Priestia endophytica]SFQ83945.1 hypothetical protein SAMN02745910_04134 [Priestia endophytica DSM 13796]
MKGEGTIDLHTTQERAFKMLLDPNVLKECMVGCKRFEKVEEGIYKANISLGFLPVKGDYDITIKLTDLKEPEQYKMKMSGKGGPGEIKMLNHIYLDEKGNTTVLSYTYEAEIHGKVTKAGKPVLKKVAGFIVKDFFKRFEKEIKRSKV